MKHQIVFMFHNGTLTKVAAVKAGKAYQKPDGSPFPYGALVGTIDEIMSTLVAEEEANKRAIARLEKRNAEIGDAAFAILQQAEDAEAMPDPVVGEIIPKVLSSKDVRVGDRIRAMYAGGDWRAYITRNGVFDSRTLRYSSIESLRNKGCLKTISEDWRGCLLEVVKLP